MKESGIIGVIHKATQGASFIDPTYDSRRPQALSAGLLWGAYHFGTGSDVQAQVDNFLDTVNPDSSTLLVLDFEPNPQGTTMSLAQAESFVDKVREATGRFPGLYSGQSFLKDTLRNNTDTILKNCFLWIARFSSIRPEIPPAFPFFTMWQYTDGALGPQPHQVPGIGRCDRERFNGDEAGVRRLFGAEVAAAAGR